MARGLWAKVALGAFFAGGSVSAQFIPFADVEELKPRRIRDHCSSEPVPGQPMNIRHCRFHFKRTLDDESEIELGWQMLADPERILSLDTEAEHGVRLQRCGPGELELLLPASHARHASQGTMIVGSRFVHRCVHRPDHQLYHRITRVHTRQWLPTEGSSPRAMLVHLHTEELESIAHAVPKLTFHFSWMPSEAISYEDFPEMKTDYGLNRQYLKAKREGTDPRRLFGFPSMKQVENMDGVDTDNGGFAAGGKATGGFDTKNGMLNLMPKQLSNFGWNWNFFMNTTEEPVFNLDAPGLAGRMKVRQPYIKVHAGIFLNFTSEFQGLTTPPYVNWSFGILGHGRVQARVVGSMNTTGDAGADPFHAFKLPILQELENPLWFQKIEFATGELPVSMEPGFKCSASMYHQGRFKGALGVGGRTKGWLKPVLHYDSVRGFDMAFTGQLDDTDLWPPMWLMFTRHFEIGVMLKPSLLMKGDFASLERATLAIDSRPYANVTITREGDPALGAATATTMKKLTAYPMRLMGINQVNFNVKYQINISANGQDVETSPQVNWGQVEYRDHISNFDLGSIPQEVLMNTTQTKFIVTLSQLSDLGAPGKTAMGTGVATCASILNGECQPSPVNVAINNENGQTIATLQMAILWQDNPAPWFSSKIRGLAFSFPQVILRQDTLTAAFPDAEQPEVGSEATQISLHMQRGGQTYIIGLNGTIGSQQSALAGNGVIDFPPSFIDTWKPCTIATPKCFSPTLSLFAGTTKIAQATMPLIDFASATSMEGTSSSGFMGTGSSTELRVPSTMALTAPGDAGATIALVTMEAKADFTLESSIFLQPRAQVMVPTGGTEKLEWMISDVVKTTEYTFTLVALRLTPVAPTNSESYSNLRSVNDNVLEPVAASTQSTTAKCKTQEADGLPAARAPCTFSVDFKFGSGFSTGDQFVIEVSWTSGGLRHMMYSAPIEISSGRRLLAHDKPAIAEFVAPHVASVPRRLWSQEAWNNRINQHAAACDREDLKFNFGLGMLIRGKIDSISVPKGFPMIGGLSEEPELTTGFRNIDIMHPAEDAKDAFGGNGSIFCQMGLCRGYLPGCARAEDTVMHFAKIVFDFNRPYHFHNESGHFNGMFKQAMAYAFSTLPEMVDIVIQKMNTTDKKAPTPAPEDDDEEENWWKSRPTPSPQPSAPAQMSPSPAPKEDSRLKNAFNKWWSGATGRRLDIHRSSLQVGDQDALPAALESHQVRVEFKKGLPFVVDRPLVELMMQHGYFWGIEDVKDDHYDEHGPLQITRFYVDSGSPIAVDGERRDFTHERKAGPASYTAVTRGALVFSAAVLGVAAVFVLHSWRSPTIVGLDMGAASDDGAFGLE